MILYLSGENSGVGCAYLDVSLLGIFGKGILQGIFHHGYFFGANRIVAQVRTLLNAGIFDNLLRLEQSALIDILQRDRLSSW